MIFENLTNFALVIAIQFLFFLFHAYKIGDLDEVFHYLKKGMIIGLPFGITLDLFFGHYLGLWDYALGYNWWFLTINSFSYGFMVANVFLLYHHTFRHMYFWSVGLAIVYEVSNYFFPVWEWTFAISVTEYSAVILVGYAGLTATMMLIMRFVYRFHFRLIPF